MSTSPYLWRAGRSQYSTRTSQASSQASCPSPSRQITIRPGYREWAVGRRWSPPLHWAPRQGPFLWATPRTSSPSSPARRPGQPSPPLLSGRHWAPFLWATSPSRRKISNRYRILKNRQLLRVLPLDLYPWGSFPARRESQSVQTMPGCRPQSLLRETGARHSKLQSVVKSSKQLRPNKRLPENHRENCLLLRRTTREKNQKVQTTGRIRRSMLFLSK